MIRPKQPDATGSGAILYAHVIEGSTGTATAAAPFGTTGGIVSADSTLQTVATSTTFTLPVAGNWLFAISWNASAVTGPPSASLGGNISALNFMNHGYQPSTSASYNSAASMFTETVSVSTAGTGAANKVTISGGSALSVGNTDLFIVQLPTVVDSLKKKGTEVSVLKEQVAELGRMMKALLVKIPDNDGQIIMCEEKDDCEVVDRLRASGPASSGVRKGTSSITDPGYKAPPSSNNVTPLSGKQGLSKLFF